MSDSALQALAIDDARDRLAALHPVSGTTQAGGAELLFEVATAPPALVVFGAGYDAEPVARQAWALGFAITVVDVREAFLTPARFPGAELVAAHFSEFAARVQVGPRTFVLIMNHHLERDRESLRFALASGAGYIGVLGPRSRYEALIAGLRAGGFAPAEEALARVRSPVGLALGAETPAEVAISIVGEILAVRHGFDGGFLDGTVTSLHRPDDSRLLARS